MSKIKRVLVIGGTGFLGFHTTLEFLDNGWEASALGLPPAPSANFFPPGVKIILCDLDATNDEDLSSFLKGHDALIFSAGMDDRFTPAKPAYPKFYHANVEVPLRILKLAGQVGIKNAVVFGSYFSYFHRLWPEMDLIGRHPYIRSRVEQELALTSIQGLNVSVLELPYIFGDPLGRKPLWYPLVKYIRAAPLVLYMHGGTACISARTVGRAAFCAIERGLQSSCYPIGQENLTWVELLTRLARADGRTIRVIKLPSLLIRIGLLGVFVLHKFQGKEGGLNPLYFSTLQTVETFLDPGLSLNALGYILDDLDVSFQETVAACK